MTLEQATNGSQFYLMRPDRPATSTPVDQGAPEQAGYDREFALLAREAALNGWPQEAEARAAQEQQADHAAALQQYVARRYGAHAARSSSAPVAEPSAPPVQEALPPRSMTEPTYNRNYNGVQYHVSADGIWTPIANTPDTAGDAYDHTSRPLYDTPDYRISEITHKMNADHRRNQRRQARVERQAARAERRQERHDRVRQFLGRTAVSVALRFGSLRKGGGQRAAGQHAHA